MNKERKKAIESLTPQNVTREKKKEIHYSTYISN